jgi:hypothetical protein
MMLCCVAGGHENGDDHHRRTEFAIICTISLLASPLEHDAQHIDAQVYTESICDGWMCCLRPSFLHAAVQ